jgi:Putative peptidoglycan binding domain
MDAWVYIAGREWHSEMMTTRDEILHIALGYNGTCDGQGYDAPNPFSADLGRSAEAWCGDFVTDIYKRAQVPLPSMQPGCRTGFAYCPDAVDYGQAHNATRWSWQAEPGDIVLFDWSGGEIAQHTEIATSYEGGALFTIGGNSGPSNVDRFVGEGGVHRHSWDAPAGQGNNEVLVVIDTSKVVHFGGPAHPTQPGNPPPAGPRLLMLKSPMTSGADVLAVQQALNQRNNAGLATDGIYRPLTRDAVINWQQRAQIAADGIVGPQTRTSLGLPATS